MEGTAAHADSETYTSPDELPPEAVRAAIDGREQDASRATRADRDAARRALRRADYFSSYKPCTAGVGHSCRATMAFRVHRARFFTTAQSAMWCVTISLMCTTATATTSANSSSRESGRTSAIANYDAPLWANQVQDLCCGSFTPGPWSPADLVLSSTSVTLEKIFMAARQ